MHAITVQEFVNKNKVVLDCLLVEFAEITSANVDNAVTEFKDEGCIGVPTAHSNNVKVLVANVEEGSRAEGDDGRAHVCVGNDLDAKYISNRSSIVININNDINIG